MVVTLSVTGPLLSIPLFITLLSEPVGGVRRWARKVVVPNAGHILPMHQPAAFNRVLLEFLLDT